MAVLTIQAPHIEMENSEVQQKATNARKRGRNNTVIIAPEIRLHRRGQKPQLKHDKCSYDAEYAQHNGPALAARKC